MIAFAIFLVLCSGFIHAVWNLFAKSSINKNVFLWYCQLFAVLLFLPWAASELGAVNLSVDTVCLLTASAGLHGMYVLLLAKAYTVADLSQAYPIMRGTSPLILADSLDCHFTT